MNMKLVVSIYLEDIKVNTDWLKRFKSPHGIQKLEIQMKYISGNITQAEILKGT